MKAKEKAEQLVNSFYYALPNNGSSTGLNSTTARYKEATVCALIAVDEILKINKLADENLNYKEYFNDCTDFKSYWQEVKQELEIKKDKQ